MFFSSVRYLRNAKNLTYVCQTKQTFPIAINASILNSQKAFSPCLYIVAGKKQYAAELGLPERPKRPIPAFIRYSKEEFKKYANMRLRDSLGKIAESWRALPESEKTKYFEETNSEWQLYRQKLDKYKESLTPDQIKEAKILDNAKESLKTVEKKRIRKESTALGKPKWPGNAFTLFCEKFMMDGKKTEASTTLQYLRTQYQNLTENEKQSYQEEFKKRQFKYQEDLDKWEKKMIDSGRNDLVRKLTLKQIKK